MDRMDGMDSTAAATGWGGKCGNMGRGLGALCEEKPRGAKVGGPNGGIKGEGAEGGGMTGELCEVGKGEVKEGEGSGGAGLGSELVGVPGGVHPRTVLAAQAGEKDGHGSALVLGFPRAEVSGRSGHREPIAGPTPPL